MRPVLFELGPPGVDSYGIFIALGFGAAWLGLRHELARGRLTVRGETHLLQCLVDYSMSPRRSTR